MENNNWHKGYKEVKNTIHNEIGITKEEILEVFRQVAKDEIQKIVSEKRTFIYESIREVIRDEMIDAVSEHKYPKIRGNVWDYGYNGRGENSFKNFVSGVMKEEIVNSLREQFELDLDIKKK